MDVQKKFNGQVEINDLIAEAVSNAAARRNQAIDGEELLSDEQAAGVKGGLSFAPIIPPIVMGIIYVPPGKFPIA